MKIRERKDLHTKSLDELKKVLYEAKKALAELSLSHAQGKLKNTGSLSQKRREIAVVHSIMHGKKEVKNG